MKKNILFLTVFEINNLDEREIYQDLLRKFTQEGHNVTIVTPLERRRKLKTSFMVHKGYNILKVKTLNITKTNVFEKGLATLAIEYQYLKAIKKHLSNIKFDVVLYSTPPITFAKVIDYIKKRDNAYSYLLLKDIFPQNAVDMQMIKEGGVIHNQFLKKERKLYQLSDTIGCMSPANVNFLMNSNPYLDKSKIEVNPNSIDPFPVTLNEDEKTAIRLKYEIPLNKKVLVYGGNLGKPQGLDFLLEVMASNSNPNAFFLIVGNGTEFNKIDKWFKNIIPNNAKLIQRLPKEDYTRLLNACDIGLIFLHGDFLIPNFPSRLLSYLEMKKPVISATDTNTDIGDIIEENKCGYKVITGDIKSMNNTINKIVNEDDLEELGQNGWELLINQYTVDKSYNLIMDKIV